MFGEDKVEFPPETKNSKELKTDSGEDIFMKGKKYFFMAANSNLREIKIGKTEFDEYKWLTYNEAMDLTEKIYQTGKKRITMKVLDLLKHYKLII